MRSSAGVPSLDKSPAATPQPGTSRPRLLSVGLPLPKQCCGIFRARNAPNVTCSSQRRTGDVRAGQRCVLALVGIVARLLTRCRLRRPPVGAHQGAAPRRGYPTTPSYTFKFQRHLCGRRRCTAAAAAAESVLCLAGTCACPGAMAWPAAAPHQSQSLDGQLGDVADLLNHPEVSEQVAPVGLGALLARTGTPSAVGS